MNVVRTTLDFINGFFVALRTGNRPGSVLARGKHRISLVDGNIIFEKRVFLYPDIKISVRGIDKKSELKICAGTNIGDRSEIHVGNKVEIGRNCAISWDVCIMDHDYHVINGSHEVAKPVIIEDNVWIGCRVTILKGVRICSGAVIGAGSVVTKNVPANVLVSGNPAKILHENVMWR